VAENKGEDFRHFPVAAGPPEQMIVLANALLRANRKWELKTA
jgi:hypothetical protein